MLTRSVVVATTLTVCLVAGVGSSALAIAFVPGNASGVSQSVQAIAAPAQDPAEGSVSSMIAGGPVTIAVAKPITIDGGDDTPASEEDLTAGVPTSEPAPVAPGNTSGNSGNGSTNSGSGNSGTSSEDKAKEDKAKEDKAKKDKEDKAKEDKAKEDKAKEDKAKKDKEDKAKKDKESESPE